MTKYRVEVHKCGGGYSSTPFPTLAAAKEFFQLHKTAAVDLVQLKEWQKDSCEPDWRLCGAWVCIDEFHHCGA